MIRSHYHIKDMDCPSELNLIKTKLGSQIKGAEADFRRRGTLVISPGKTADLSEKIAVLNLGSKWLRDEKAPALPQEHSGERRKLIWVLIINFTFFLIELLGLLLVGASMGLAADGLDMLADALVYGLSIWALNHNLEKERNVARLAKFFQILLAIIAFIEVLRRTFFATDIPHFETMIYVSMAALIANAVCLIILRQSQSDKVSFKASLIFTSNDVLINIGVVLSAVLVSYFNSAWPDLLIGAAVVTSGAIWRQKNISLGQIAFN